MYKNWEIIMFQQSQIAATSLNQINAQFWLEGWFLQLAHNWLGGISGRGFDSSLKVDKAVLLWVTLADGQMNSSGGLLVSGCLWDFLVTTKQACVFNSEIGVLSDFLSQSWQQLLTWHTKAPFWWPWSQQHVILTTLHYQNCLACHPSLPR